jgi:hypothetical protein
MKQNMRFYAFELTFFPLLCYASHSDWSRVANPHSGGLHRQIPLASLLLAQIPNSRIFSRESAYTTHGTRLLPKRRSSFSSMATTLERPAGIMTFEKIKGLELTRASDGERVKLSSLWRKDLAFGIGGERAVIVFLRHFG